MSLPNYHSPTQSHQDNYKRYRRYFRIINNPETPKNTNNSERTPQKVTEQIVKGHNKYVYIDINEKYGVKAMERIDPEKESIDIENQKIGRNVIGSLHLLSPQSQKTLDYVYKIKDGIREKERVSKLMKKKIDRTLDLQKKQRVNKRKQRQRETSNARNQSMMSVLVGLSGINSNEKNESQQRKQQQQKKNQIMEKAIDSIHKRSKSSFLTLQSIQTSLLREVMSNQKDIVHMGMKTQNLKDILAKKQLQRRNSEIIEREKKLIEKYGLTNEYHSVSKQITPIIRSKGKVFLPEIKNNSVSKINLL